MRRIHLLLLAGTLAACTARDTLAPVETDPSLRFGFARREVDLCLTLLHNNDGESDLVNAGLGREDFGGVARFATVVERLRTAGEEGTADPALAEECSGKFIDRSGTLLVSSGDNFLAGVEFNASQDLGIPFDAIALDRIKYDALAIGNHEFDFGPSVFAKFVRAFTESRPPFLSANLDVSGEAELRQLEFFRRIGKSRVVLVKGRAIGIIGATTPRLPFISSPGAVRVNADVAGAIQAEVQRLQRLGVNKIILISHLQSRLEDEALIPLLRDVDIVVAGGGDDLLANADDRLVPGDVAVAPYPIIARDADGREVPVITTSGSYQYVGRLIVGFDRDGNIVRTSDASGPVRVAGGANPDAVEPEPTIQRDVVEPVQAYVNNLALTVVARSEVALEGRRSPGVRTIETNLGNLVADAHLFNARARASQFGQPVPQVALQNGGGIRNNSLLPAGDLSVKTTFDILPFANFISIVPSVPREQFKEILENAVSRVEFNDGRFPQIAGFRFTWDANRVAQVLDTTAANRGSVITPGSRIRDVVLDDGTVIVAGGAIQAGPAITVATIDFLANGGDEYPFRGLPFTSVGVTYQQSLQFYLRDGLGGVVTAAQYPEGGSRRITRQN